MHAPAGENRADLRLAVAQMECRLRDIPANAAAVSAAAAAAGAAGAGLVLTPELSLTGYDLGDAVHRMGVAAEPGAELGGLFPSALPGGADVVVGLVEAAPGGPYNAACVIRDGRVVHRHRKIYLPTYGMFDEGRWFGRGGRLDTFTTTGGWRCGLLICEDFWHPGLAYVLASRGIDLLLVQAAAPGRGAWEGGAQGAFASTDAWERIARTVAQLYGVYVALCNRAGVEGGVTFAGGSLVAGPDGVILDRAGEGTALLDVRLSPSHLLRSRQPFAHARDDDPSLVVRELQRGPG
jgi:NAD+ synthase (glutamine-hydrolysing)